ncbi:zeta toxin family protein [Streptomyces sp. AC627_RSS907]|uniref:zeta toxin family protein n=1 Tax=Streptomyces sp. AC627_RSS907 TaxID=2823684 RepID=UPI001C213DC3|nr:zeta toxin family protein [Streptomyces sp. AC627_RSS907]
MSPRTVPVSTLPGDPLRTILPAFLASASRSARPRALIIAGAPGSGKTTTADRLQTVARPGVVRICADLLKGAHPDYAPALAADEQRAGLVVRADTRRWAQDLAARARFLGADTVEEIALDDPQALRVMSAAYRFAGYRIHLLVLDVPDAVGQLRITTRHLRQAREFGVVRYVSAAHRGACADQLPDALAVADSERLVDRVTVLGHQGRVLYRNALIGGVWARPAGAVAAVAAARQQMWDTRLQESFERAAAAVARALREERLAGHRRQTGTEDLETARRLAARQRPATDAGEQFGCLPHGQRVRIFKRDIIPLHLKYITEHEDPHVIYVMSQPGGGKSLRSRDILSQHRTRAPTLISSDYLKAAHPDYRRLLVQDPRTAGAVIRPDYQFWRAQAEARVREGRGDAVIEMAPGTPEEFGASMSGFAADGYRITLVVVAVRAADSRQATALRYLQQTRQGTPARFTTARGHDQCFTAVTQCTAHAAHEPSITTLQVVDRQGRCLYAGCGRTDDAAAAALEGERTRRYSRHEAQQFLGQHAELLAHLPQYRVELDEIAALATPFMPKPHAGSTG